MASPYVIIFFFSSRRRHTRLQGDWSSDVCSSDLIQANPTALASYGLSLEDLRTALGQANVDQAKGTFDGLHQAYTIGANDQLVSSDSYRPLIIAYRNGAPVRLTDIATVVDGVENAKQAAWANRDPAVILNIQRQPGANIDRKSVV